MGYKLKRILIYPDGVTEKQVRPTYAWSILSSTVAYYPFADNNYDATGNTTLNKSGTKQSIGYEFTSSSAYDRVSASGTSNTSAFLSAWIYIKSPTVGTITSGPGGLGYLAKGKMRYNYVHQSTPDCIQFSHNSSSWTNKRVYGNNNQWFHIAFGYNGTEAYYYKNGVKTIVLTTSSPTIATQTGSLVVGNDLGGYDVILSDFIVDEANRESEIVAYFNNTKSNYGF